MLARVAVAVVVGSFVAGCAQATRTTTITRTVTQRILLAAHADIPGADPDRAWADLHPVLADAPAFAPEYAHVYELREIPSAAGIPPQLVVGWEARLPGGGSATGLSIWQHLRPRGYGPRWRRIYRVRRPPNTPRVGVELGDVTRDGHLDALLLMSNGSAHGCGPRRLLALGWGRVRSLFATDGYCDPAPVLRGHDLVLETPEGIEESICCPAFRHRRVLRWDGKRLRAVSETWFAFCILGGTYCEDTRAPAPAVRFAPGSITWWDSRRGVATGVDANGSGLELVATTTDAGMHWMLVLSTHLRLRRPHIDTHGRSTIVGVHCGHQGCRPQRLFRATGFGRLWTQEAVRG